MEIFFFTKEVGNLMWKLYFNYAGRNHQKCQQIQN